MSPARGAGDCAMTILTSEDRQVDRSDFCGPLVTPSSALVPVDSWPITIPPSSAAYIPSSALHLPTAPDLDVASEPADRIADPVRFVHWTIRSADDSGRQISIGIERLLCRQFGPVFDRRVVNHISTLTLWWAEMPRRKVWICTHQGEITRVYLFLNGKT